MPFYARYAGLLVAMVPSVFDMSPGTVKVHNILFLEFVLIFQRPSANSQESLSTVRCRLGTDAKNSDFVVTYHLVSNIFSHAR